jgi:rhodanese-related sulfurtransferase
MQQVNSITVTDLKQLMDSQAAFQLIDTRESYEHEAFNIGGTLLPLAHITKHLDAIEKAIPVVLYCRVGMRSQIAIQRLQEKYPFQNLYNLTGGIEAWKKVFTDRYNG